MHPLVYGDYPPVMRSGAGDRLPRFTAEESARVRGSFDLVGFNHYLVMRVAAAEADSGSKPRDYYVDAAVQCNVAVLNYMQSNLCLCSLVLTEGIVRSDVADPLDQIAEVKWQPSNTVSAIRLCVP